MTRAQEQRAAAMAEAPVVPVDGVRIQSFPALLRVAQPIDWFGQLRYQLDGVASTVEQPYRMYDAFGEYDEVISRNAFDQTLLRDPDVAFLVNHKGVTMARSRPNAQGQRSLDMRMGQTGLETRAYLNPQRQDVQDLVHAIQDGNITEMSFAFRIDDGEWNDDFSQFRINKVDLDRGDVSAVNYGANPYTSIAARSSELLRDLDRLPVGAARAALERLQARPELEPSAVDLVARKYGEVHREARQKVVHEYGPELSSGDGGTVLPPSPLLSPVEKLTEQRGVTFTVAGDKWYLIKPEAEIFARAVGSDEMISLGWVDDLEQDDHPAGPGRVRTSPLPPSALIPPVAGLGNDQRSDLGRSVRLVRTEWLLDEEWAEDD